MSEGSEKPESGAAGEPPRADTTASSEGPRWAADEPTAMWDDKALRDEGYSGVADAAPGIAASGPATSPDVGGHERANVVPQAAAAAQPSATPAAPAARGGGLSWPLTIAIATLVAVLVYFAVRMMR